MIPVEMESVASGWVMQETLPNASFKGKENNESIPSCRPLYHTVSSAPCGTESPDCILPTATTYSWTYGP